MESRENQDLDYLDINFSRKVLGHRGVKYRGTADQVNYTVKTAVIHGQLVEVKVYDSPSDKEYDSGRMKAMPTEGGYSNGPPLIHLLGRITYDY